MTLTNPNITKMPVFLVIVVAATNSNWPKAITEPPAKSPILNVVS